jgi:cardiolipin synthase
MACKTSNAKKMPGTFLAYLASYTAMNAYRYAKRVELVFSGKDYFERLRTMIRESITEIHIQMYIFELDTTGKALLEELKDAAKRGVSISFLADGYGSRKISKKDILFIRSMGIRFRLFSTFFSKESIYMGRRLHHKLIVVDRQKALIGGINIADKYRGTTEPPWLDYGIQITGTICGELAELCQAFYEKRKPQQLTTGNSSDGEIEIRFLRNDWVTGLNQIHRSYRKAVDDANKKIIFVASYFLPGIRFRRALSNAKRRGISVELILAGRSDMPFLFYAEKYFYPFFHQNGITIYEWQDSVMHAKAMLVDDDWVTIGSYNVNPVSHYLSIELNAVIKNRTFSNEFKDHLEKIKRDSCREIKPSDPHSRSRISKIRNSLVYYFFKFIFMIFISRKR